MVNCYCGCDSKANRVKFLVSGVLLFLSFIFVISAGSAVNKCFQAVNFECIRANQAEQWTTWVELNCDEHQLEVDECWREHGSWLTFTYLAYILSLIGSSIPMCMLCCCSSPPDTKDAVRDAPVQMVERAAVKEHAGKQYTSIPASEAAGHAVTSGLPVLPVEEP